MEQFQLIIDEPQAPIDLVKLVRHYGGSSLSEIRQALASGMPVVSETIHHNQYDEFIDKTLPLLNELEAKGYRFRLMVEGVEESLDYVRNEFQQWRDIQVATRREDELRFNETD